jgi:hypothetical protein
MAAGSIKSAHYKAPHALRSPKPHHHPQRHAAARPPKRSGFRRFGGRRETASCTGRAVAYRVFRVGIHVRASRLPNPALGPSRVPMI